MSNQMDVGALDKYLDVINVADQSDEETQCLVCDKTPGCGLEWAPAGSLCVDDMPRATVDADVDTDDDDADGM